MSNSRRVDEYHDVHNLNVNSTMSISRDTNNNDDDCTEKNREASYASSDDDVALRHALQNSETAVWPTADSDLCSVEAS